MRMRKQNQFMLTAEVPKELAIRARVEAAKRDISRSELVRVALVEHLARLEGSSNGQQKNANTV